MSSLDGSKLKSVILILFLSVSTVYGFVNEPALKKPVARHWKLLRLIHPSDILDNYIFFPRQIAKMTLFILQT